MSPTERSLAEMRKRGYTCAVVEKWNPHARIRQDLWGFVDIVCIGEGETIGVQACAYSSVSSRVNKVTEHDNLPAVRKAGWRVLVQGWNGTKLREIDLS